MEVNGANLKIFYTNANTLFNQGFKSGMPQWNKVATLVTSKTGKEEFAWLGAFPKIREWVGERHYNRLKGHKYEIVNKDFESTVTVPRNDIEDDTYGVYSPLFEELGFATAVFPDEVVFGALDLGWAALCYDGQNFFDTDHPVGSGTVSNAQAGGGNSWFLLDTTRKLKPMIYQVRKPFNFVRKDAETDEHVFNKKEFVYGTDGRMNFGFGFWQMAFASKAALDATNFDAAVAAMMAFTDDSGRKLGIMPNLLVVGPSNRAAAKQLIEAENLASGASNTNFKAVEVLVTPWLP